MTCFATYKTGFLALCPLIFFPCFFTACPVRAETVIDAQQERIWINYVQNISTPCINSNNTLAVNRRTGFVVKKKTTKDENWMLRNLKFTLARWVHHAQTSSSALREDRCDFLFCFITKKSILTVQHSSFCRPSHVAYCLTWDLKGNLPCRLDKNRITERRWTVKICVCVRSCADVPPQCNQWSLHFLS